MKKIILVLLTVLTLSACSSNSLTITDGDTQIISGDKVSYTKQEFYDDLKGNDYTPVILSDLTKKIAKLENLDLSDVDKMVEEDIAELKTQYGDAYESVMAYYGGIDTVKANLNSGIIAEKLAKNYFELEYETLKNTYMPKKAKIAYFDTEDQANKMLEEIKAGKTFEMAAAENGYGSEIRENVVTDKSELAVEIKKFISDVKEATLSEVIASTITTQGQDGTTNATTKYYVVEVTNTDVDSFKDEFINTLNTTVDSTTIFNFYFNKYDIEVYDQATYDLLSSNYEGIK